MKKGNLNIINDDCIKVMQSYPDNYFDLAIVDPPYGIGASEMTMGSGKKKKYKKGKKWDSKIPSLEYFAELQRISKQQIIWGGNYFSHLLRPSRCYIFWDKGINGDCSFADGELAWCSFDKVLRKAPIRYKGFLGADNVRIHPTQKPIKLYDWILKNYASKSMKVIDTHLGSGSSAISAYYYGVSEFVGIEIDKDYFSAATKRIDEQTNQLNLF
jgi:site-specific DNA-methyltransferase (adenine-specific)